LVDSVESTFNYVLNNFCDS